MARFTVGCVPYVNAIPLIYPFLALGDESPVEVVYDVPSKLPMMLESGKAQAVLVSIYDPLTVPGRKLVGGIGIGSDGPVRSVRLFSKKPFSEIESLALDSSSMTSNALAQIILREVYGGTHKLGIAAPSIDAMLTEFDACVLIGDIGMAPMIRSDLHVLDLGLAWRELTGLPFTWAGWVGHNSLDVELTSLLQDAFLRPECLSVESSISNWIPAAQEQSEFSSERLLEYFSQDVRYIMDDRSLEGIRVFGQRLGSIGVGQSTFPEVIRELAVP